MTMTGTKGTAVSHKNKRRTRRLCRVAITITVLHLLLPAAAPLPTPRTAIRAAPTVTPIPSLTSTARPLSHCPAVQNPRRSRSAPRADDALQFDPGGSNGNGDGTRPTFGTAHRADDDGAGPAPRAARRCLLAPPPPLPRHRRRSVLLIASAVAAAPWNTWGVPAAVAVAVGGVVDPVVEGGTVADYCRNMANIEGVL